MYYCTVFFGSKQSSNRLHSPSVTRLIVMIIGRFKVQGLGLNNLFLEPQPLNV